MKNGLLTLETWIERNPTWKTLILENHLDPKLFDHQLNIRIEALKLATREWIDYLFKNTI